MPYNFFFINIIIKNSVIKKITDPKIYGHSNNPWVKRRIKNQAKVAIRERV